jgi:hypothetical protein
MSCFIYSWDGLSTALHVCELVEDRTVIWWFSIRKTKSFKRKESLQW